VGGLTACTPYVSHAVAPGHADRLESVLRFYGASPPAERAALLDRLCVTHMALPGGLGETPDGWLAPPSPFRRVAALGDGPREIALYSRTGPSPCPSGPPE
jgi:hypothetical protein